MPYSPAEASKHTRKANSPSKKRQWSHVFNSMLERGSSEKSAFRAAAGTVKRNKSRRSRRTSKR